VVIGKGPGATARSRWISRRFTLVGATTRAGLLPAPLRDRFGFTAHLDFYQPDELEIIIRRSAGLLGVTLTDEGATELSTRSRGTPRIANRLLRRVRDYAEVRADGCRHPGDRAGPRWRSTRWTSRAWTGSTGGCSTRSCVASGGGPVGLSTLAVALGEEAETGRGGRRAVPGPVRAAGEDPARPVGDPRAGWAHLGLEPPPSLAEPPSLFD